MPPCEGGYKEFKIGKLFETPQNSQKIDKLALSNNGSIPVFSSNSTNNGIIGYCDLEPHWKVDEQKPIYLLFGDHTRTFHIAKTDFCITDNVKVLLPKYSAINERVLLYIIAAWKKCIPNLGYARHWSQAKLVKILLPTTSTGEIDFQFMESRIRELEEERMRELEAYLTAAGFADCSLTPTEEEALRKFSNGEVRFKKYTIGKLFEIHPTKSYGETNATLFADLGKTPVVVNSSMNNGIGGWINRSATEKGNMLTYSDTTTSDAIFYQPFDFIGYSHVQGLYPLEREWSENELLYFLSIFKKTASGRFDYATKFTRQIASCLDITLPINTDNEIDYDFMETYISAIKKQIIQQLKDFISKERVAYQQVINEE